MHQECFVGLRNLRHKSPVWCGAAASDVVSDFDNSKLTLPQMARLREGDKARESPRSVLPQPLFFTLRFLRQSTENKTMTTLSNKGLQLNEIHVTTKQTPFLDRALPLARLGIRVFPCDVRGKEPVKLESGVRLSPLKHAMWHEEAIVEQWGGPEFADCNVGCFFSRATQNNFVVDVDSVSACEKILGHPLSLTGVAEVQSSTQDKRHVYFAGKVPDWFWAFNADYTDESGVKHELFSVRNKNRYTVGPNSVHPSGVSYRWLNGEPTQLPPLDEALLRELQLIAEKKGCKQPNPQVDGDPMPIEQYEDWVENLRNNFERIIPKYQIEERTSQRHGGVEFVICPCPLGEHSAGNNTGLISVAPSGKLGWNCFHSSHTMPWSEARKMIENQAGVTFIFPSGPEPIIGSRKSKSESVEEARVEFAPDSIARLEIDCADYLDDLAEELTRETRLPFAFARENLKMLFLSSLPDENSRPVLPWFHKLHTREYVILVSDAPGAGKGETFRRSRATIEKASIQLEFIRGESLGSPEWACVALGGERETLRKRDAEPDKSGKTKSGIDVQINAGRPGGRIVHYDEGKKLFQKDSVGRGGERGLLTMFTSLFEDNQHSTGSFTNGKACVAAANVSLMLHFTRAGFDKCFMGSGATRDGFLSRCVIVSDYGNEVEGEWRSVSGERVRELVEKLKACLSRTELPEEEGARESRLEYLRQLRKQDPLYSARLEFLFVQDLYARSLFSPEGCITTEAVNRAITWAHHQLVTRQALWPMDSSYDKAERMYHTLRAGYQKHKRLTHAQAKRLCNVSREGSGGISVYQRVHIDLLRTHEIVQAGVNRRGKAVFECAETD